MSLGLWATTKWESARMEQLGVIERVENHKDRCAGIVVAPKSSRNVRIKCADLTVLNKSVKGETFPLPRVDESPTSSEHIRAFYKTRDDISEFWNIDTKCLGS